MKKRKQSFKNSTTNSRADRNISRILIKILVGTLVTLAVFIGIYVWRLGEYRTWYGIEPWRVIVLTQKDGEISQINTIHYLPDKERVLILPIPEEVMVDVPGGYGKYRLGSVSRLSLIERENYSLVEESLESLMAMPYDRLIVSNAEVLDKDTSLNLMWNSMMKHLFDRKLLADDFSVWWRMRSVRGESFTQLELADKVLRQEKAVDGAEIVEVERLQLDETILANLVPINQDLTKITVVVENTIGESGLASIWSKRLKHAGFDVINMVDSSAMLEKTTLVFESYELKSSLSGKVLSKTIPIDEVIIGEVGEYRARVVLKLGKDFSRK